MPTQRINWGLIGTTGWADSTFGPAIAGADSASLYAVLGSTPEKAQAFCEKHEVPKCYHELDAFLADEAIQAVWIASPNYMHAPQAIAALHAGKHVLVEKPMALSVAEGEQMVAAARDSKRKLGVGYHLRHHPIHREIHREWEQEKYGRPVFFRAQLYYAYPELPPVWRQKKATSGGWAISDVGTHLIDLALWFMGEPSAAQGILTNFKYGLETEDHAAVVMRFKNGATAVCDASTGAGGPARFELYGTEGWCVCENTYFGHGGLITRGRGNERPVVSGAHNSNPYKLQVEAFDRWVMGRDEFPTPGHVGLENLRIMQIARGY